MRKFVIAALLLIATPALADWSVDAMNKQIDATNFMVNRGCSGTLIAPGYILTADHCIQQQYETIEHDKIGADGKVERAKTRVARPGTVSQIFYSGPNEMQRNSYVYKIVSADASLDLALLRIESRLDNKPAQLSCKSLRRGDKVYAVGNSYGILYSTVTVGIVSSLERSYRDLGVVGELEGSETDSGEHGFVQHSAPIVGGNSGGALYDEDGKFSGVNVRGGATGFSFSVPLSDVKSFLYGTGAVLEGECK